MATIVPAPVLDARDEAQVAAEAIGGLPPEMSDRSDSNPAVVLLEAGAYVYGRLMYQLNRWPSAVVQKILSLIGITLAPAVGATVSQQFTLSTPQARDTVIPTGTTVAIEDGTVTFATLADLTIAAYTAETGTVAVSAGSAAVVGTGTTFVTGSTWEGWQIEIPRGSGNWFTIDSVTDTTHLTLSETVANATSGAFYVGPVTGDVSAQATTTGADTNVGADTLTVVQSAPSFVASTTNVAAATGGADEETVAAAIERAATAFAARDVACSLVDYALFAERILGQGGRAKASANMNGTTPTAGYVTVALLSPAWSTSTPVSSSERGATVRDLSQRSFIAATLVDVPATITSYTPIVVVYRNAAFDASTVKAAIGAALNDYFSPSTYEWGRTAYVTDIADQAERVTGVDRVYAVNGVVAAAMSSTASAATATFTTGSASVTGVGAGDYAAATAGRTFVVAPDGYAYLVTAKAGGNTFTIDQVYIGSTSTASFRYFTSGDTAMASWYTLPYAALSTDSASPPSTVIVQGSV